MRRPLLCLAGLAAATALAACGAPPPATATATATATTTPTAALTPAPDVNRIDLVSTGLGAYQAVVVPVAVLHNAATRTGVTGLVVHFVPTRAGRPLTPLDSPAVTLYPGQTLAVTATCTDSCNCTAACANPDAVTVTVGTGTWSPLPGSAITAGTATAACVSGCRGAGQWDVTATVGNPQLAQGARVDLFAWCVNGAGAIIGGGQRQVIWPQSGGSLALDLPTILSAPPGSCTVAASAPI